MPPDHCPDLGNVKSRFLHAPMTALNGFSFHSKVPSLVDITQDEDPYLRIGVRPLKDIPCMQYNDTEGT